MINIILPEKLEPSNFSITYYRKEKHYNMSMLVLAVNKIGEIQELIEARFYRTQARSYCCIWIRAPDFSIVGGAYAGGYGYHKDSTSLEKAINSTCIKVEFLEGRGNSKMESALIELGKELSKNLELSNFKVITTHG